MLAQVFLLGLLEQLLSSADGQQDGFGVAAVVQAQVYRSLEIAHQQRLAYQAVGIFKSGARGESAGPSEQLL